MYLSNLNLITIFSTTTTKKALKTLNFCYKLFLFLFCSLFCCIVEVLCVYPSSLLGTQIRDALNKKLL